MFLRRLSAVAIIAAAIAFPATASADYVGPSSAPKYTFATGSLNNACQTFISAVSGKRFRVWSFILNSGEASGGNAGTWQFRDTTALSLSPAFRLPQNVTITNGPAGSLPVFETTTTNAGLRICNTTASASTFNLQMTYTEFDPAATAKYNETFLSENATVAVADQPVEVECTDGCSGGAGGGDVTLTAIEGDALPWLDERLQALVMAGILGVILLTFVAVRLFPRKKLPT